MKSSYKKAAACALAFALAFTACGNDDSSGTETSGWLAEVANVEELETYECDVSIIGEKIYVVDIGQNYECDGKQWFKSYDQTKPDSNAVKSSSSKKSNSSSSRQCRDCGDDESSSSMASSNLNHDADWACPNITYTESYNWIDGKTVFPVGTFECSAPECLSDQPLNPNKIYGEILDERDGQVYKVIRIGNYVWFAHNLNFDTEASSSYGEYIGRLYSWCDLMDLPKEQCGEDFFSNISDIEHQGICPDGWHVPNTEEFTDLYCAIGMENFKYKVTSRAATESINTMDDDKWVTESESINISGFSVVYDDRYVVFANSTEYDESSPWIMGWITSWTFELELKTILSSNSESKRTKMAVRCVKNETNKKAGSGPALPTCNSSNEGLVAPKDTMHFICTENKWRRADDLQKDTFGKTCSSTDIGVVIKGNVNDSMDYCCTAIGWVNMLHWSWDVPKQNRLNPDIKYDSIVDKRDGKIYKTVTINDKVWMAENLNYADTEKSPYLEGNSWCYDNEERHCDVGGRLYSWDAAMHEICPEGFRLPNYEDWREMHWNIGLLKTRSGWDRYRYCLVCTDYGWKTDDGNGSDSLGFSAMPVGYFSKFDEKFYGEGARTGYWLSSEKDSTSADCFILDNDDNTGTITMNIRNNKKTDGYSIRCVKD